MIGLLGLTAAVLGYVGFDRRYGDQRSVADKVYLTIQLFSFGSGDIERPGTALEIARWLAPVTVAYAGLRALASLFRDQLARARVRWTMSDHVIVCGLGGCGVPLARSFHRRGDRVVAVEKDLANPAVAECRAEGIVVLVGDASDPPVLAHAGVGKARVLVAVCGDDGTSAAVATAARTAPRGRHRGPLRLYVHIADFELCRLLNERALASSVPGSRVEFLNRDESAPPALLAQYAPIDGASGDSPPYLVVAGMGRLGERLIAHAAYQWRLTRPPAAGPMRATILDVEADDHRASLERRYRGIADVCALDARTLDPAAPGPDPLTLNGTPTAVFVCLDDDARGLQAALAIRRRLRSPAVPVVVCTTARGGLAHLLGTQGKGDIHSFPLRERACHTEAVLNGGNEVLARAIHDDYVRQQTAKGATVESNPSLVGWGDLPETLKDSNRGQAAAIGSKLAAVGCDLESWTDWDAPAVVFTDDEVELLAQQEHDRWWKEREGAGWVFGPVKDAARKTSPYLVPWESLPEEVRELDREPVRALPTFLAKAGFTVTCAARSRGR